MFPTYQWETSNFLLGGDFSYPATMMTLKEIVELRLRELGLGPVEAATASGIERTYIRDIVEGKKKSVRNDKLPGLARALRLDPAALSRLEILRTDDSGALHDTKTSVMAVKVIGKIAAHWWSNVEDMDFSYDDQEEIPSVGGYPIEWQFGLIVDGNCLNKVAQHGERLVCLDIIKSGADILPNDLAIVQLTRHNGQEVMRTAKRVRKTAEGYELWPESTDPNHQEPLILNGEENAEIQIIGKVLWIMKRP